MPAFDNSARYWEDRYQSGGRSGSGSYGYLAEYKAKILNAFVKKAHIRSVIEFGCGDGNQLSLAEYPQYLGVDVSPTAISTCRARFASDGSKTFQLYNRPWRGKAELTLSLDVIYHLVEDDVYRWYMADLFGSATRYVIVYSTDRRSWWRKDPHVKHRKFTRDIPTGWHLVERVRNPYRHRTREHRKRSKSDFFVFQRASYILSP